LVRQEIDLARTEMTSKAMSVGRDAALIGVGGAIAYGGALVLLGALVLILVQLGLEAWLAALVVGVIAVVIGAVLVQQGRSRITTVDVVPTRTIETLKDEAEWAKEQIT
jgi:O-antigen ligase